LNFSPQLYLAGSESQSEGMLEKKAGTPFLGNSGLRSLGKIRYAFLYDY